MVNNIIFSELFEKDSYMIVGSFPLGIRVPKDIDVVIHSKNLKIKPDKINDYIGSYSYKNIKVELLLTDNDISLSHLLECYQNTELSQLEILYILKRGHIYTCKTFEKFNKHINDIIYLKDKISNISSLLPYIKLHKKCTEERIKIRTPKLNGVNIDKFFDDKVKKYYVHDHLHEIIAHNNRPMFESMQLGDGTVQCHKYLWNKFTQLEKIQCVLEESYVIAFERCLVPLYMGDSLDIKTPQQAFDWALYRICTNLCSGWFRDFAIDNYKEVKDNYNSEYINIFQSKLNL